MTDEAAYFLEPEGTEATEVNAFFPMTEGRYCRAEIILVL